MGFIHLYFRGLILFVMAFAASNVAARAFGRAGSPHTALAGFTEGCEATPQPCWYGIVPGRTTVEEAKSILIAYGYILPGEQRFDYAILNTEMFSQPGGEGCRVSLGGRLGVVRVNPVNRPLTSLSIECDSLRLGDLMTYLGAPQTVDLCGLILRYPNSLELIDSGAVLSQLSPYKTGMRLFIDQERSFIANPRPNLWRGFARCWRYQQDGSIARN